MIKNALGKEMNGMSLTGTLQAQQTLTGEFSKADALEGNLANEVLRGYSAYQVAVLNGFEGTEKEWLDSLVDVMVSDDGEGNITFLTTKVVNVEDAPYTYSETDKVIEKEE